MTSVRSPGFSKPSLVMLLPALTSRRIAAASRTIRA
jgi:hypothetical protein